MNVKKRNSRAPLTVRKQTDFITQCQQGSRQRNAYWASIFLQMLSRRTKPIKKTGTVADWFLNSCIAAWKKKDAVFFEDIAKTVKRGTDSVHANPAGHRLMVYFLEHPLGDEEKERYFSIGEIQEICGGGISERTAGRLAQDLGIKIRPKGAHGKRWEKRVKIGT